MKTLAEVEQPREYKAGVLETDLQKQCVQWARSRAYWARKFSSMTQRSVPDYLFATLIRSGALRKEIKFACEFKRPGTKPKYIEKHDVTVMSTEAQFEEQEIMRHAGWYAFECDDFEEFKKIVVGLEDNYQRMMEKYE